MKRTNLMIIVLLIVFTITSLPFSGCNPAPKAQQEGSDLAGLITVSGAWALYPMMVRWAEEFLKGDKEE